jgi:hypothetical protein
MLAQIDALRVAPVPPREERGAFDPPFASRPPEGVGTKGVPTINPTPPARVEQRAFWDSVFT